MTAVSSVSNTGDPYVDGILTGVKWATGSLTYSFPTDPSLYGSYGSAEPTTNFKAFTTVQQAAVKSVLQTYSSVANVHFTEVTESSTSSGDLRYAESDSTSTAWGYYPSTSAKGGDMWFNNSSHYYDNPVRGNYGFMTMMHETGHAMGLKHPQDTMGSFGAMPLDHDSVEYSVMSYRSYIGSGTSGYTMASSSYPQSLMMFDIAALQTMYGANYITQSGDSVYRWDPATGQETINGVSQGPLAGNKIFLTIWDGGGNDTYDFSNYATNLKVDLDPGAWTTLSTTQLASLGSGHYAAGNIANALMFQGNAASLIENAIGGSGADSIVGNQADNHLTGKGGNDVMDGDIGTDTAVYTGLSTDYAWTQNADGSWQVADLRAGSPDGTDTLKNIEQLQFSDGTTTWLGAQPPPPPPPPPQPVPNSAPLIVSAATSVTLTEWADLSTAESSNTAHTASGSIAFSDADATDTHVASFVAEASGYLGTFKLGALNETADNVGWSFSVADSALNYLNAGQSLTQRYDVSIDDGHGGTAMQAVTIVLAGANDTTTITSTTTRLHGNGKGKGGTTTTASGNDESMLNDQAPAPSPSDHFSFASGASPDTVPHIGAQGLWLPDTSTAPVHVADAMVHLPDVVLGVDMHGIDMILHGHGLIGHG